MAGQFEGLDLTPRMAQVIKIFLADPTRERYGYDLMQVTGMQSGSLYPLLARFEAAGWLTTGKEDIDPRAEGRPARRFYRISAAAVPAARQQLAELSELYRPPVPANPRVVCESGER
jgi:PadR family transcriptional regulator PadR